MIQVIDRFHRILEYVAEKPEKLHSLGELADHLEISPSTCANIVKTMVGLGYLRQNPDRKGYLLGYTSFYITRNGAYKQHLIMTARRQIEQLAHELDEMVVLVTECAGRRVELLRSEGNAPIQVRNTDIQGAFHLWGTVTGVVILSHYPDERRRYYWNNCPHDNNIFHCHSFEETTAVLNQVRESRCFVCDDGLKVHNEPSNAFVSLAAPVFENDSIAAAVGLKVPAYRFTGAHRDRVIAGCQATAEAISALSAGTRGNSETGAA